MTTEVPVSAVDISVAEDELKKPMASTTKFNATRRSLIVIFLLLVSGGIIGILLFQSLHDQQTYNESKEILQYLKESKGLKLNVKLTGTLSNYIVENATHSLPQSIVVYAIPDKTSTEEYAMDFYITYEDHNYQYGSEDVVLTYHIIVSKDHGYFKITTPTTLVTDYCLNEADIPPVENIVSSLLDGEVVMKTSQIKKEYRDQLQCGGKTVFGVWNEKSYLYCIESDEASQRYIRSIVGKDIYASIEYLNHDEVDEISSKFVIPDSIDGLFVNETIRCPKLNLYTRVKEEFDLETEEERRLSVEFEGEYQADSGNDELDYGDFAELANTLDCDHICVGTDSTSWESIQLSELPLDGGYQDTNDFSRKLQDVEVIKDSGVTQQLSDGTMVTVPRPCVFMDGVSYFKRALDFDALPEVWGNMHEEPPCYCSSTSFIRTNTKRFSWNSEKGQEYLCIAIRRVIEKKLPHLYEAGSTVLDNLIIFTHTSAAFTLGAALANEYCTLGDNTRWVTIQTPVLGLDIDEKKVKNGCTRKKIKEASRLWFPEYRRRYGVIRNGDKYNMKDEAYSAAMNMSTFPQLELFKDCFPGKVFEGSTFKDLGKLFLKSLKRRHTKEDLLGTIYEKTKSKIAKHASAAMCGSPRGIPITPDRRALELANQLGVGYADMISGKNCKALRNVKVEGKKRRDIKFKKTPTSKFYSSETSLQDVANYVDSATNPRQQYKQWVQSNQAMVDAQQQNGKITFHSEIAHDYVSRRVRKRA